MSDFAIQLLQPQDLHDVWGFIKVGLEEIRAKHKRSWFAEDIYAAISTGRAECLIGKVDEHVIGFSVGTIQPIPLTNKKEYFIWVMWRYRRFDTNGINIYKEALEFLKRRGKELGCARLHHYSPRKGFQRTFEVEDISYVFNLDSN